MQRRCAGRCSTGGQVGVGGVEMKGRCAAGAPFSARAVLPLPCTVSAKFSPRAPAARPKSKRNPAPISPPNTTAQSTPARPL